MILKGKTILITGGARGIGQELAKQLRSLGNQVIITGRNLEKLDQIQTQFPDIQTIRLDLSKKDFLNDLIQNPPSFLKEVDVLINNAGVGRRLNLTEHINEFDLLDEIQVNLCAPIQLINFLLPQLLKKKEAAIINITSALAFLPLAAVPIYSATKAGLHSYTLSLRQQLSKSSVKVFEISPPTTDTEMLKGFQNQDLKGVKPMATETLIKLSLQDIEDDKFEICPGHSKQLKVMSRYLPQFAFNKMNKNLI